MTGVANLKISENFCDYLLMGFDVEVAHSLGFSFTSAIVLTTVCATIIQRYVINAAKCSEYTYKHDKDADNTAHTQLRVRKQD